MSSDTSFDNIIRLLKSANKVRGTGELSLAWEQSVMREIRSTYAPDAGTSPVEYSRSFFRFGFAALAAAVVVQATYTLTGIEDSIKGAEEARVIQSLQDFEFFSSDNGEG